MARRIRLTGFVAITVMCTVFVVCVINFLIYQARYLFIQGHPDYVAQQPPTISRAISDPAIGEPFANWMLICAPVLFVAVGAIILILYRDLRRNWQDGVVSRHWANGLFVFWALVQFGACVGMIILSQYRFPDYNDLHMGGSYLFFFAQGFSVLAAGTAAGYLCRLPYQVPGITLPEMNKMRARLMWVPVGMAIIYLGLFLLKDVGPLKGSYALLQLYVWTEIALISTFLVYLGLHVVDLVIWMWRQRSR